jgi:hypothetical protein
MTDTKLASSSVAVLEEIDVSATESKVASNSVAVLYTTTDPNGPTNIGIDPGSGEVSYSGSQPSASQSQNIASIDAASIAYTGNQVTAEVNITNKVAFIGASDYLYSGTQPSLVNSLTNPSITAGSASIVYDGQQTLIPGAYIALIGNGAVTYTGNPNPAAGSVIDIQSGNVIYVGHRINDYELFEVEVTAESSLSAYSDYEFSVSLESSLSSYKNYTFSITGESSLFLTYKEIIIFR